MDLFKKLPYDIQLIIYNNVNYRKKYDNFVKDFNNIILNLTFTEYNYDMKNDGMKLDEALDLVLENLNLEEIYLFMYDIKFVEDFYLKKYKN